MNIAPSKPCTTWATRLAARHPSDLSPAERTDLQAHLKTCAACASASAAYALMETAIRNLPPVTPLAELALEQPTSDMSNVEQPPILLSSYTRRTNRTRPQPSRFVRRANLLAAVLVVALLIVGSSVLFYAHLSGSTAGVTPQAPCTNDKSTGDPVPILLCLHQQLVNINQSQTVGDFTITLQRGYVDANQLLVVYKITTRKPLPGLSQRFDVTLQNASGSIFLGATSMGMGGDGDKVNGDYSFELWMPNRGTFPQDLRVFNLQITTHNYHSTETTNQPSTSPITARFSFSLPFHAGRILNLHDTITAKGTAYTLDKTIITPNITAFYVSGISWDRVGNYTLALNGKNLTNYVQGPLPSVVPPNQAPYTVFQVENDQPFYQHGTLTLTINVLTSRTTNQTTPYIWTIHV